MEIGEPIWVPKGSNVEAASEALRVAMETQLDRQRAAYPVLTGADLRYVPARLGGTATFDSKNPTTSDIAMRIVVNAVSSPLTASCSRNDEMLRKLRLPGTSSMTPTIAGTAAGLRATRL